MKSTQTIHEDFACPNCGESNFKQNNKKFQCESCGHTFTIEDVLNKVADDFMDDLEELILHETEVNIDISLNKVKK